VKKEFVHVSTTDIIANDSYTRLTCTQNVLLLLSVLCYLTLYIITEHTLSQYLKLVLLLLLLLLLAI